MLRQTLIRSLLQFGIGVLLWSTALLAQEDGNGVSVLTKPYYTKEQVEKAGGEIPPVRFEAPKDRWERLPRTAVLLGQGRGELRVVMLGDSIINDTSQSRWDDLVQGMYPRCRITKVTCVRGSTGCWWYKEPGRVKRYVLDHHPDLLIIGGISQRDDTESIRAVIRQVRAGSRCDILLLSGVFGYVDPNDDMQWSFRIGPAATDYRAGLRQLAENEKAAFFDMTAYWGKYIRESGKELKWFKRDAVHANERGQQVIGRLLAGYLAPPVGRD
jgi:hypothetical protein